MSEADWFLQANVKVGDQMINVRGVDANDLLINLEALAEMSGRAVDALKLIGAAALEINNSYAPKSDSGSRGSSGPAKSDWKPPAASGGSGGSASGHTCAHGERVYKTGETNGKQWKGWMCPSRDRKDQCKAEWINS